MGMNNTPASDRVHIGFFGRRNAGKSSVLNAVTGQNLAVVSNVKGTTTDPVYKAMELLPLGPVMMIDTPGIDDEGELGSLRVRKSYQVLNKTDVAVLVVDHCHGMTPEDSSLLKRIEEKRIPCVIVCNKMDLEQEDPGQVDWKQSLPLVKVSALTGQGIADLKECLAALGKVRENSRRIVGDLLEPQDFAVLVVPIDKAAPKGRLILPQQQTIRDILEADATAIVLKENELAGVLPALGKKPKMVITDSQAFSEVAEVVPDHVLLTSFSVLMARYKGFLDAAASGVKAVNQILISEGCTHHRQCNDIGTVKIPAWIKKYTGKNVIIETSSGRSFPEDLSGYRLVIHCGGCMLNEREVRYRMQCAGDAGVPFTNYGMVIAQMKGILERSMEIFRKVQ